MQNHFQRFVVFFFVLINNVCYSPSRLGSQEDDSKCDKVSGSFNTLNIDLFDRIFCWVGSCWSARYSCELWCSTNIFITTASHHHLPRTTPPTPPPPPPPPCTRSSIAPQQMAGTTERIKNICEWKWFTK